MFSLAMLVRLGKVTEQDIKLSFAAFRKLDVHNDGVLNSKSIIAGMIQRRKTTALNRMGVEPPTPLQPTPQQMRVQPPLQRMKVQTTPKQLQPPDPSYTSLHSSWNSGASGWFYGSENTQGNHEQVPLFADKLPYNSIGVQQARVSVLGKGNTSE
jgi:hypothetical protein